MYPPEACDCGIHIGSGLAAAHDAGVVHRDLKPENLFLTKNGIKILDFGLARFAQPKANDATAATLHQPTEPGQIAGTVGYMVPEQVRDWQPTRGATSSHLAQFCTRCSPGSAHFAMPTTAETLSAVLNEEPPPLSLSVRDLPPALQRILSRCLEKKPERRFQHASDLGFALEALSDARGTALAQPLQAGKHGRWIWTAAALSVVVATALIIWWRQPPALPVVTAVTQLTSDGEVKANGGRMAADGSRIHFGEGTVGSYRIMQVAAAGGPTALIPTRLANFQFTALSRDGLYLLGAAGDAFALPFWAVPLPSGEPRRLGSIISQDADLFPDGRMLCRA